LNDEDREKIFKECSRTHDDKIIITHGTDTMVETANKLHSISKEVIILTGSMRPERFADSDAPFNIGVAVGAINILREGVYIAMNDRIYSWKNVMRNLKTGQFIES
jgi:L-asparaginase